MFVCAFSVYYLLAHLFLCVCFLELFKLLNRIQKVLEILYNVLRSNVTLVCLEKNGGVMVEVMP